jgi:hypothetical protein
MSWGQPTGLCLFGEICGFRSRERNVAGRGLIEFLKGLPHNDTRFGLPTEACSLIA